MQGLIRVALFATKCEGTDVALDSRLLSAGMTELLAKVRMSHLMRPREGLLTTGELTGCPAGVTIPPFSGLYVGFFFLNSRLLLRE